MRHRARIHAVQALYQAEVWKGRTPELTEQLLTELELPADTAQFTRELTAGTLKYRRDIDRLLRMHLEHWKLERLSSTTRNILRLATYELCYGPPLPHHVVFDEALELGKEFVDEQFHGLINRVLQKIYDALQLEKVAPEEEPSPPEATSE
jgi:N utilization substance protein B